MDPTHTGPPDYRDSFLDIAQALAAGWERQRERIEQLAAPMRAWLIRQLAPQPG